MRQPQAQLKPYQTKLKTLEMRPSGDLFQVRIHDKANFGELEPLRVPLSKKMPYEDEAPGQI